MKNKTTQLSESQIVSFISDFYRDSDYAKLKDLYLSKSFPEILSVDRREMSHSSFLSWLVNKDESHGLREFPFLQFLKILITRDLAQGRDRHKYNQTSTKDLAVSVINEDLLITEMSVGIERHAKTKNEQGRIDVIIDGKLILEKNKNPRGIHIIIENKVYSSEHDKQTEKYFASIRPEIDCHKQDFYLFVYLTPLRNRDLDLLSKPECACEEFIQINYQDILNTILEPALNKDISSRTRFIIEEYIQSLALPALTNNNYNPNTVMATSDNTKKILYSFWKKNEQLLMAVLNSLLNETDDQNVIDALEPAVSALATNARREKDKTHYLVNGEETKGKGEKSALVSSVVCFLLGKGIKPEEVSRAYASAIEYLNKFDTVEVFKQIQKKLEGKDVNMTCPAPDELWPVKRIYNSFVKGTQKLVFTAAEYSDWWPNQGKKKEIYAHVQNYEQNIDVYISNQWGYDSIDYFLYSVYCNIEVWGVTDLKIEVIKH